MALRNIIHLSSAAVVAAAIVLAIAGCSSQTSEPEDAPPAVPNSTSGSGAEPPDGIPASWSSEEKNLFAVLSAAYPQTSSINMAGKTGIMDSAHLTCEAYDEGMTRLQILDALDNPSLPSGLMDDLMTLAVSAFCPQYMDIQLR